MFGADNSWSSLTDNHADKFLVLGAGPTNDINSSVGTTKKKIGIHFTEVNAKFSLRFHYNGDSSD